jgi:hypothetical protein
MSGIMHPKLNVSARADYRRSDYLFTRAQSVAYSQLEWERRTPGLRSWNDLIIPALAATAAMAAVVAALY